MSDPDPLKFRIYPAWKDVMVYDEGEGRIIRFDCGSVGETFEVTVPSTDSWADETPAWAHERRNLIVARLRAAKCNITESGQFLRTQFSPDGTFRVEIYCEPDPPFPPQEEIRVLAPAVHQFIARLPGAGLGGTITFPLPGVVLIPFTLRGGREQISRHHQIRIDLPARTFSLDPNERPEELRDLPKVLASLYPKHGERPPAKKKSWAGPIGNFLLCLCFVAGGAWMAVDGQRTRDHILGTLCAFFFTLCLALPISEMMTLWKNRK